MSQSTELTAQSGDERVQQALERIEADTCGVALKAALRLVAQGATYREASRQAGLASHQDVFRRAKTLGLADGHVETLKSQYRRLASLSNMELEHRLTEAPDEISDRDMIVISGVSADKLARLESQGSPGSTPLSQLFEMLHQGGRLTIEGPQGGSTIEQVDPIDVTPTDPATS